VRPAALTRLPLSARGPPRRPNSRCAIPTPCMLETRPNREQHSTDKRRCRAPARCRATAPTAAGDGAPGEMSTLLPPGGFASGEDVLNGGPERLVALLDAYLDEHGIRDTSNSVPFTMYVQLTVPLSKVVLFERWVQNLVRASPSRCSRYQPTAYDQPDARAGLLGPWCLTGQGHEVSQTTGLCHCAGGSAEPDPCGLPGHASLPARRGSA